ncbi:hypothetical protein L345_08322, partial [Ophiophagus hannah]
MSYFVLGFTARSPQVRRLNKKYRKKVAMYGEQSAKKHPKQSREGGREGKRREGKA